MKLVADEKANGETLGIYYDSSPHLPDYLTSFCVFCSPKQTGEEIAGIDNHHLQLPHYPTYSPFLRSSSWDRFISRALLVNLTRLTSCSIRSRCTGLMLTYTDDTQEILGQWYGDLPSGEIIEMSDFKPGSFVGLGFALSSDKLWNCPPTSGSLYLLLLSQGSQQ